MTYIKYKDFKKYENYTAKQFYDNTVYHKFTLEIKNLLFGIDWDYEKNCFYIVDNFDSNLLDYDDKLRNKNFKKIKTLIKEIKKKTQKYSKKYTKSFKSVKG